jgi:hypothetical protein
MAKHETLTQDEFRKLCTPEQWKAYVAAVLLDAADEDEYFRKGKQLGFVHNDDGGGITAVWSENDTEFMEADPIDDEEDEP